jgi:hypothetical protein
MTYQLNVTAGLRGTSYMLPWAAVAATFASIFLIAALHLLKPDYDPAWRFLSEYSIGDYGFVMQLAFFAMAVASLAVAASLWHHAYTVTAKIGLALHAVIGLSLVGAALFVADPVTAQPSQMTSHGMIHSIFALLGIPGMPIGALAVLYGMTIRGTPDRGKLRMPAWAMLLSVVIMIVYMNFLMAGGAKIGPADYVGWANRIVVAAYDWWWISAALYAIRLNGGNATAKTKKGNGFAKRSADDAIVSNGVPPPSMS